MQSKQCPTCKNWNGADAASCWNCGHPLQDPQTKANPNIYDCLDCSGKMSQNAEYCPHCGRFYRNLRPPVTINRNGWSITVGWGIILGGVFLVLINIFAIGVLLFVTGILAATGSNAR